LKVMTLAPARVVGHRAREVIERIGALVKKAPARKDTVAIDDAIL
jgi:hypothetical protein